MRLLTCSVLACLSASAIALPARAADDVIINGLHCNTLCQSWLGVRGETAGLEARAEPKPVLRAEPLLPPTLVRLAPSAEPAIPRLPRIRTALREEPTTANLPLRVPTTDRRAIQPATMSLSVAPKSTTGGRRPAAPPLVSLPTIDVSPPRTGAPAPRVSIERSSTTPSGQDGEPAGLESGISDSVQTSLPRRVGRRVVSATAGMEPGLTTLPRLDDVVAVHGTIMIETAEERAANRRNMAELVKSTTRPKQFRTGFADPLPTIPRPRDQALSTTP